MRTALALTRIYNESRGLWFKPKAALGGQFLTLWEAHCLSSYFIAAISPPCSKVWIGTCWDP